VAPPVTVPYIWLAEDVRVGKAEYILVGSLLAAGLIAFPLVKDVYLVQSLFLSICAGLGLQ
jgi:hypothetical protein